MNEYEVRILNEGGTLALLVSEVQLTDFAAIRSAKKMAHGRRFEVWRGSICIFGAWGDLDTHMSQPEKGGERSGLSP
jgi:hypothetical protein